MSFLRHFKIYPTPFLEPNANPSCPGGANCLMAPLYAVTPPIPDDKAAKRTANMTAKQPPISQVKSMRRLRTVLCLTIKYSK